VDRSQAEAIVGLVQAYFPRPELPASTVMAWATELEPFDFGDAQEAARRLSRDYRYPVLAELIGLVDEVRRERLDAEDARPALPASEAEFLEVMPEDVRERVHAMHERWDVREQAAEAEIETDWRRRKAALLAGSGGKSCNATGAIPVIRDGKPVCPDCGVEVRDVEAEPLPPVRRRRSWKTGELA
jgi:hypothetical protein